MLAEQTTEIVTERSQKHLYTDRAFAACMLGTLSVFKSCGSDWTMRKCDLERKIILRRLER